jgi:hypothetical protein
VKELVSGHMYLSSRNETPFTSLTPDFIRALHILFYTYRDEEDVQLIIIDPRRLKSGSCLPCNKVRGQCGLQEEAVYNTEVLVWGAIPATSIIQVWRRKDIVKSGIFTGYPAIDSLPQKTKLAELRQYIKEHSYQFNAVKVSKALVRLGMDPSSAQTKQVFLFLLARIEGIEAQKLFHKAEIQLEEARAKDIHSFDSVTYTAYIAAGKQKFVELLKKEPEHRLHGCRCKKQAACRNGAHCILDWLEMQANELCPSVERWMQSRQDQNLQTVSDETDAGDATWQLWLAQHARKGYFIGFAD